MKIGIRINREGTHSVSTSSYTNNLIENLVRLTKDKHEIFTILKNKNNWYSNKFENSIVIPYLKFPDLFLLNDLHEPFLLTKYNFDIIHYTTGYPITFKFSRVKNIKTTHGMICRLIYPHLCRDIDRYLIKLNILKIRKMDTVISASESEKQDLVKYGKIPEDKIKVIPFGINRNVFKILGGKYKEAVKKEIKKKYGLDSFIIHVSDLSYVKNVPMLIKAYAKLKAECKISQKLVVIGDYKRKTIQDNIQKIRGAINDYSISRYVIFTGQISQYELVKFYNTADLLVLPSLSESFSFVLLEGMASGCPIVTSNISVCPEVVGDAAMLIDPYNMYDIADAVYEVINNKSLRKYLIKKGLERIKKFTWENCAQKTLEVYKEAAKK